MRRQDKGGSLRLQACEDPPELAPRVRVEAGGRLVEDQELRMVYQGDAEGQLLALAVREVHRVAAAFFEKADMLEDPRHLIGGAAVKPGEEIHDLAHGELVYESRLLQRDPHDSPEPSLVVPPGPPENGDIARIGGPQPLYHLDEGRLPRAVRAEEGDILPGGHLQAHFLNGPYILERFRNVGHVDHFFSLRVRGSFSGKVGKSKMATPVGLEPTTPSLEG